MALADTRYRHGYGAVVAEGLPGASAVVAATFLLFVLWHPLSLEGTALPVMTAVAALTALVTGAAAARFEREPVPPARAHAVGAAIAALVFANCAVQYAIAEQDYLTVNVTLIAVSVGVCLVDPRWVAGVVGGLVAAWLALLTAITSVDAALTALAPLVLGSIVAALANVVRRGTLHRLLDTQDELRTLSQRDDLTGLLNRRGFLEAAQARLDQGRPVRVWFIDVDGLKHVNDTQGHDVGDVLLVTVATALADVFSGGVVARLSGDEFAVVEDHGTADGVVRARCALEERLGLAAAVTGLPMSVSTGTASATAGSTLSDVLSAADTAMYADKAARRATAPPVQAGDVRLPAPRGQAPSRPL
ncbi:MAG TPA: GGDEF domain-containing protein [Mycobacteriales bacterium]|nr:GGDEF domain-containing protein [Mycobacteriales bacterium]